MSEGDSVSAAKRRAATDHVLSATRRLLGSEGLDVTMDQIADASGVSRRTLFRQFETRERLIAAAFANGMRRYGDLLPAPSDHWQGWIHDLCEVAHRMNASYGAGYWEMQTRADLPPELAKVERRRREARQAAMRRIADNLWSASGGTAQTPEMLVHCVGAHLSAHFTAAVVGDADSTPETAAALAEHAIVATLQDLGTAAPSRS